MQTQLQTYPYIYDHLLSRLHTIKTTKIVNKAMLPPIKIIRKNKTSVFVNFNIYPEILKRTAEHISNYFKEELRTQNSINAEGQLIMNCIVNDIKCESILKKYIKEFVSCKQCKGINSTLIKEQGMTFIKCNECFANTSLGKI